MLPGIVHGVVDIDRAIRSTHPDLPSVINLNSGKGIAGKPLRICERREQAIREIKSGQAAACRRPERVAGRGDTHDSFHVRVILPLPNTSKHIGEEYKGKETSRQTLQACTEENIQLHRIFPTPSVMTFDSASSSSLGHSLSNSPSQSR